MCIKIIRFGKTCSNNTFTSDVKNLKYPPPTYNRKTVQNISCYKLNNREDNYVRKQAKFISISTAATLTYLTLPYLTLPYLPTAVANNTGALVSLIQLYKGFPLCFAIKAMPSVFSNL
jgi:hypothetical protein